MQLFRLAYKNIVHRKARFILTTLAVVVGVTLVSGIFIFTDSVRSIFTDLSRDIAGESQLIIRSEIDFGDRNLAPPLPIELKSELEEVEGVETVESAIVEFGLILKHLDNEVIGSNAEGAPVVGSNWDESTTRRNNFLIRGRQPTGPQEFAVDDATAENNELKIGEKFIITIPAGESAGSAQYTLVGTFRLGAREDGLAGAQLIVFDTPTAIKLLNDDKGIDQYEVYTEAGSNPLEVVTNLESVLNSQEIKNILTTANVKAEVVATEQFADEVSDDFSGIIDFFRVVLLIFAFVILFVSAFVIFNTFSIILDQRIKELGLLRAVGLGGRQLSQLVLGESFIVGIAATVIGLAGGVGVFYFLVVLINATSGGGFSAISLVFHYRTVIWAATLGIGLTMLAALPSAIRSRRVPPIAALREGTNATAQTEAKHRPIVGSIVMLAGIGIAVFCLFQPWRVIALVTPVSALAVYWGGIRIKKLFGNFIILAMGITWMFLAWGLTKWINDFSLAGALVIFAMGLLITIMGFNIASPFFGRPLSKLLGFPLKKMYGITGTLGVENAARNPQRTANTAIVFIISIALISVATIASSSIGATFSTVLDGVVKSDYIICKQQCRGDNPDIYFATNIGGEIGKLAIVESAQPFSYIEQGIRVPHTIDSSGVRTERNEEFDITTTNLTTIQQHLNLDLDDATASFDLSRNDVIFISQDRAENYSLEIGSTINTVFPSGAEAELTVAGIFADELTQVIGEWVMNVELVDKHIATRRDFLISVQAVDGVSKKQIEEATTSIFEINDPDLKVFTKKEYNDRLIGNLNGGTNIVQVFLYVTFIVAALGIANTLTLSIFERTREIGLLRAVGMKRRLVRRMVRIEGLIVSAFGGLLGLALGVLSSIIIIQVLPDEFISTISIPIIPTQIFPLPNGILFPVFLAILIGALGTLFPAAKAGRLNILNAIHEN